MKIAVWHYLPFGGAKRALYDHLKGLVELGHQVEIWQPALPKDDLDLSQFGPVHVVPQGFAERPDLKSALTRFPRMMKEFKAHAAKVGPMIDASGCDLLFANNSLHFNTPFIGRYVHRMPKVVYLQDPFRALYEPMPKLPLLPPGPGASLKAKVKDAVYWPQYRKLAWEELESIRSYDLVLCNSYFSREAILRAFGISASVCYLGIDVDHFRYAPKPRERYVFGLGTCGPMKGVREAILAIGAMREPRPKLVWSANMVDEIYLAELIPLAKSLKVDFHLERMLPDAEVERHLQTAGALIYTSRLEPFGLVPLEANACGLPVVAVAEGGVRETVKDGINGILSDPSPAALASALEELLDNPEKRDLLGASARAYVVENWGTGNAARALESFLLGAAENSRPGSNNA